MKFFKKSKPETETPTKPIDNYSTESGDNLANEIIPVLKEIMLTGKNNLVNGKPIKEVVVLVNDHQTRCKRISPFHSSIYSEYTKNDLLELYNLYDYSFLFDTILNNIILKMKDIIINGNMDPFRFFDHSELYTNSIGKFKFGISSRDGFDVDFEWRLSQLFKFKSENVVFLKYGQNYPISESKYNEYLSLVAEINKIKNNELL